MTMLSTMARGARNLRASVTLDNINLSQDYVGSRPGVTSGRIMLVGDKSASFELLYREQLWVRILVDKLTKGVARLPLNSYLRGGQPGEREKMRDGWLPELLAAPSPTRRMSPFEWKAAIVRNVAVHGNCVAVKVRAGIGRPPVELIPTSFAFWRVQGDPIEWYIYSQNDGKRIPFTPDEVVHFQWGTGVFGVSPSPLEALVRTLQVEDAAQRTQIASYANGARPVGAFVGPAGKENIIPKTEIERMRAELTSTYGGVDNAFKIAMLQGGASWVPMSHNLVDAEIVNARRLTREEVCAAYDVPPPMVGILDKATFSNIDEQHVMLYQDTMGPWLTMLEEALHVQLVEPEPMEPGRYLEFDINEVLKGDIVKRYGAYGQANFMTPNEKRIRENLPPLDDERANWAWIAAGSIPIGPGSEAFTQPAKVAESVTPQQVPPGR